MSNSFSMLEGHELQRSTSFRTDRDSRRVTHALDLEEFSTRGASTLRSARDFIDALKQLRVSGPFPLIEKLETSDLVGIGGQASVFRSAVSGVEASDSIRDYYTVAIKKSHINLNVDAVRDMNDDDLRKQVHDMYLEILALCQRDLRTHRNIMRLIGWTSQQEEGNVPMLILELAKCDLSTFVRSDICDGITRQHLCLDIACGLEALHDSGVIHGDLKPANVLVRHANPHETSTPFIALLADFGFSILEAESLTDGQIEIGGYTPEWCAPEVLDGASQSPRGTLSTRGYRQADIFSSGLVMWDIVTSGINSAAQLTSKEIGSYVANQVFALKDLGQEFQAALSTTLYEALRFDPSLRPLQLLPLLSNASSACNAWNAACTTYRQHQNFDNNVANKPYDWQIPRIDHYSMQTQAETFHMYGDTMLPSELFTMFLRASTRFMNTHVHVTADSYHLRALRLAAEKGFMPAQAVVYRVFTSLEADLPDLGKLIIWLFAGASAGCHLALQDLMTIDVSKAKESQFLLRRDDMDMPYYYDEPHRQLWRRCKAYVQHCVSSGANDSRSSTLVRPKEISRNDKSQDINNARILMFACTAGCANTVFSLFKLDPGCTAVLKDYRTTHLHWLFNFPEDQMGEIADVFINRGLNIDALDPYGVPRHHYPYLWPTGTPLHRAVVAGSKAATRILLDRGANPLIRNRQDPYQHDENERFLDSNVNENDDAASNLDCKPEGLTPLDLAVANFDWEIIEIFASYEKARDGVNDTDEEGYTAFHRLQYQMVRRTANYNSFSQNCFLGNRATRISKKLKTIQALQKMGGDINQLTVKSKHNDTELGSTGNFNPLMLAARRGDFEVVSALLACGADVTARNSRGLNALCRLPFAHEPNVEADMISSVVRILLEHGADPNMGSFTARQFRTPLIAACAAGSIESVRLMLASGADLLAWDRDVSMLVVLLRGYLSCWYTSGNQEESQDLDQELSDILTEYVLNLPDSTRLQHVLEHVDVRGGSLLHHAARVGHTKFVSAILAHGANPNIFRHWEPKRKLLAVESTYSVVVPWGTPLDCVLETRHDAIASLERSNDLRRSRARVYERTFQKLDEIESLLLEHGGRFMRPIGRCF